MHDLVAGLVIIEMIDCLNWIFIGFVAFFAVATIASIVIIFQRLEDLRRRQESLAEPCDLHSDRRSGGSHDRDALALDEY
jgi:hypothetical protein